MDMQGESVVEEWDGEVNSSASSGVKVYAAGAEVGLPARHHSHHAIKFTTYEEFAAMGTIWIGI